MKLLDDAKTAMISRLCLILYSVFIVLVPLTPNPYTLVVNTVGTLTALASVTICLLYFRSFVLLQ